MTTVTKTTFDGRLITINDKNLDQLKLDNSNIIGENYIRDFYNCYENLDIRILRDSRLLDLAEKVNQMSRQIADEIIRRKL